MAKRLVVDQAALNRLLTSRDGPVARDLLRRGKRVESLAKRNCPVDTGRLRASIRTAVGQDGGRKLFVRVGTDVEYAYEVHEGTPAHVIEPVNASVLHFFVDGQEVFVTRVDHPGTQGTPFLTDALEQAREG